MRREREDSVASGVTISAIRSTAASFTNSWWAALPFSLPPLPPQCRERLRRQILELAWGEGRRNVFDRAHDP